MHEAPTVVFAGGGTGGHLYPALAVADALRRMHPEVLAFFIGSRRGIEGGILEERGERHELLPVRGIDRARPLSALGALGDLLRGVARTRALFRSLRPRAVVVTGGYAAAPAGVAAVLGGVPLLVQEQNAVPGLVTRLLAPRAAEVHVAFAEAAARMRVDAARLRTTGNPVRPPAALDRRRARARMGLPPEGPVLLVVGGSQGSLALNRAVQGAVEAVERGEAARPEGLHVLWATGPAHHAGVADSPAGRAAWVHAVPYLGEMPVALAASDLALARAGAIFTAELLVQGLPAILVPLPTAAADHQTRNAEALEAAGAAVMLPEAGLTPGALWETVSGLVADEERLAAMGAAARERARPGATAEIAAAVAALAHLAPAGADGGEEPR